MSFFERDPQEIIRELETANIGLAKRAQKAEREVATLRVSVEDASMKAGYVNEQNEKLRALLLDAEWGIGHECCQFGCCAREGEPHFDGCRWAAAMGRPTVPLDEEES